MEAPHVTEIAYIPLKPNTSLSGPSSSAKIWSQTTATISSQPGCLGINYGRTIERTDLVVMMIRVTPSLPTEKKGKHELIVECEDWKTLQHHRDFESTLGYPSFLSNLGAIIDGPVQIFHWTPAPSCDLLSTAPVIEFALFVKIHPEFPGAVGRFIGGVGTPEGGKGWASGGVVEEGVCKHGDFMGGEEEMEDSEGREGKAFVLLGGWESVDAHMRFRETDVFKENVGFLRGNHGGVEMVSSSASGMRLCADEISSMLLSRQLISEI